MRPRLYSYPFVEADVDQEIVPVTHIYAHTPSLHGAPEHLFAMRASLPSIVVVLGTAPAQNCLAYAALAPTPHAHLLAIPPLRTILLVQVRAPLGTYLVSISASEVDILLCSMALASLPTELIEQIAECLDLESCRSLRLTSPWLTQQLHHQFGHRFFSKQTVSWEVDCLRRLRDITSSSLGQTLQHLVIDATPRFSVKIRELEKKLREFVVDTHSKETVEYRSLEEALATVEQKAIAAAKYWNETRYDQKILAIVFGKARNIQFITFAYDGLHGYTYWDAQLHCERSQNEMSRPLVTTLAAVVAAKAQIQVISLDPIRNHGAISIGR